MGLEPVRTELQMEEMDERLRMDIFNWWYNEAAKLFREVNTDSSFINGMRILWGSFLGLPLDTYRQTKVVEEVRSVIINGIWHRIFDFLEFVYCEDFHCLIVFPYRPKVVFFGSTWISKLNPILEQNFSGYRMLNGKIVPITSESEIQEIKEAIETTSKTSLSGANEHLNTALGMLSDREKPDYRNSIKESISAVESIYRIITEDESATLGKALKKQKKLKINIHPALNNAFDILYGYTSNERGIRHALTDDTTNVDFEEAKFMMVSCSAFVNYVIGKAVKAGIRI